MNKIYLLLGLLFSFSLLSEVQTTYTSTTTGTTWAAQSWNVVGSGAPIKYVISSGHTINLNSFFSS